jgi:Cof subfamily protein (haloacid dehalogenase superfamily)
MASHKPRPEQVSLLIADVDGTLVDENKRLTERAARAVHSLAERGIRLAITSGRPPRGMAMLIEPLALTTPIAGFNGGIFVNPDLTVIEAKTLRREPAERALRIILDHRLDGWLYTGDEWLIRDANAPHVAREASTVKFEPTVTADLTPDLDSAAKIVGVSDDHDLVAACERVLQQELGGEASAARSQPYYVDVTHPEANKGFVVDYLSRHLGIPTGEIVTIGDMPNDVLMFKKSGFSIAMGNASAAVQREADVVTASHNDEGFAKAIERYLLDRRGEEGGCR